MVANCYYRCPGSVHVEQHAQGLGRISEAGKHLQQFLTFVPLSLWSLPWLTRASKLFYLLLNRGFFKGNFRTAQARGSRGGAPVGETETHCRFMKQILMAFLNSFSFMYTK